MKKEVLGILIFIFLYSCTNKKSEKDSFQSNVYDNKNVVDSNKIIKNGEHKSYYKSGQLEKKVFYENGQLNGEYLEYYENGQLLNKSFYKNGQLDSVSTSYHENGTLQEFNVYKNKIVQEENIYDNMGNLRLTSKYENGKLIEENIYNDMGNLELSSKYENGKLIKENLFFKNGKLMSSMFISNDKKSKTIKTYDIIGRITSEENYFNDSLISKKDYNNRVNTSKY